MDNGWVKLHRQMFSNKLWLSEPFTKAQAWVDLFANANHEDGSFWIRGNEIKVKRGQIGWSEITMASRWRWGRQKVRGFLAHLEHEGQIKQQKLYKLTSITTIFNYDKYQDDTTDRTTDKQQKDNRSYTNKNDKNVKNDKKNIAEANSAEVVDLIKAFEGINAAAKGMYGNTTQRQACGRLINQFSFQRVLGVIQNTLPKTNALEFFPNITTPLQLWEKWASLESSVRKHKGDKINKPNVLFS